MTVLQIAQDASDVIGIERPTSIASGTGTVDRAFRALINQGGRNLAQVRNAWGEGWTVLTREHTFTTVEDQEEYAFPDDFQALLEDTVWDRTSYYAARGPLNPQEWQLAKSGLVDSVTITPRYRIRRNSANTGHSLWLDPVPGGAEDLVLEYVSKAWLRNTNGEVLESIAADSDVPLFDADLMYMDAVWRFKQSRGLPFAGDLGEFEMQRDTRLARDAGPRAVTVARRRRRFRYPNVPEGGFGIIG